MGTFSIRHCLKSKISWIHVCTSVQYLHGVNCNDCTIQQLNNNVVDDYNIIIFNPNEHVELTGFLCKKLGVILHVWDRD
jgi:hypothetical protein